jgi:hypothetical protein
MNDVRSAIKFHLETFGDDALDTDSGLIDAFVTEVRVA